MKPSSCNACPLKAAPRCQPTYLYKKGPRRVIEADVLMLGFQPAARVAATGYAFHKFDNPVVRLGIQAVQNSYPQYENIEIEYGYTVECQTKNSKAKAKKVSVTACSSNLEQTIRDTKPKVIFAMGSDTVKQLLPGKKFKDIQGQFFDVTLFEHETKVFVGYSDKALFNPGLYHSYCRDLVNVFNVVIEGTTRKIPLDTIRKNYLLPVTADDAIAALQHIRDYADPGYDPDKWSISLDTETSSLYPFKQDGKMIALCFGWGKGKAATILFDHPHMPQAYLDRLPEIHAAAQQIFDRKPLILHNLKFDFKWLVLRYNFDLKKLAWDTMLAEHLLEENKTGSYGLKFLTSQNFPEYAGYEDSLKAIFEAADDEIERATTELMEVEAMLADKYAEHITALRQFIPAYSKWTEARTQYDIREAAYQGAKLGYQFAKAEWTEREAEWRVLYDAGVREESGKRIRKKTYCGLSPKSPRKRDICGEVPKKPSRPTDPRSKKEKQITSDRGYQDVPTDTLQLYGAIDGDITRMVCMQQVSRAKREKLLIMPMMRDHCIPATVELSRMEFHGIPVDFDYAKRLREGLSVLIEETAEELIDMMIPALPEGMTPDEINLNSSPQFGSVLYEWGWCHPDGTYYPPIKPLAFTDSGAPSTAAPSLTPLIEFEDDENTIPSHASLFLHRHFRYAKAVKARDTFLTNIEALSLLDGRTHPTFNINGTATGRLSSSDPNCQNWPKTLGGWNIKKLLIPDNPNDEVFVNVDYSSLEVMVLTVYAQDAGLIKAINDGLDMHSFVASQVFNEPYEDFIARDTLGERGKKLDKLRTNIKRVVFGTLYGAGPTKIAASIGVSKSEAIKIINLLFNTFPDIKKYIDRINKLVVDQGYVETKFGRRRRSPLAFLRDFRARAQRQAVNFMVQSTGSDIVVSQLVEFAPIIRAHGGRLLLTVHDSIGFTWPRDKIHLLPELCEHYLCTRANEKFPWLPVKLRIDIELGDNYGEVMSYDKYLAKHPYIERDRVVDEDEILNALRDDEDSSDD